MTKARTDDCVRLPVFPRCPENRPGLARLTRRIGAYPEIREALFAGLNRHTALGGWTHRKPDDPGIALLEGAAILGDILTFYQDLYANEAYLRTAQWRESVADLVRLLGYRLAPGVGGRGVAEPQELPPSPSQRTDSSMASVAAPAPVCCRPSFERPPTRLSSPANRRRAHRPRVEDARGCPRYPSRWLRIRTYGPRGLDRHRLCRSFVSTKS